VQAVAGLDLADIDVLAEALLVSLPWPTDGVLTHEVWPLVNARASLMPAGGRSFAGSPASAGLNLMAAMNPRVMTSQIRLRPATSEICDRPEAGGRDRRRRGTEAEVEHLEGRGVHHDGQIRAGRQGRS
jgi:hypothetical protein